MDSNDLATLCYPQDKYPLVVIKRTAKTLTLAYISTDGLKPTDFHNGFPVYDHRFTVEEAQELVIKDHTIKAYLTKRGTYQAYGCAPIRLGEARLYRDHSD